jgi:hypothetical protein
MATITPPVWYVRKNGWVQGPFTRSLMRHMYATSWVGAVDRVATAPGGPWRELRTVIDLADEPADAPPPPVAGGWEVASPLLRSGQSVELGMLQMFVAAGRLKPTDLVRQLPDGNWQPAGTIEGLFGGRRSWCTACGVSLGGDYRACRSCGAIQPSYEPSLATVSLVCGILAVAWYFIAIVSVTVLAIGQMTVYEIAVDEHFPLAYLLALMPSLWLSVVALWLGQWASDSVRIGRSSPADERTASFGMTLGSVTLGLLLLTGVAVVAFSLPFFGVVK